MKKKTAGRPSIEDKQERRVTIGIRGTAKNAEALKVKFQPQVDIMDAKLNKEKASK